MNLRYSLTHGLLLAVFLNPVALSAQPTETTADQQEKQEGTPLPTGRIDGPDPDLRFYYKDLPAFKLTLNNVPPRSVTYLRVYAGKELPEPADYKIAKSSYAFGNGHSPQDIEFSIGDCDLFADTSGLTTYELVQETPSGTAVLDRCLVYIDGSTTAEWSIEKEAHQKALEDWYTSAGPIPTGSSPEHTQLIKTILALPVEAPPRPVQPKK